MPKMIRHRFIVVFLVATLLCRRAESSVDVCWRGDSDCPACPSGSSSFSSLLYLSASNLNLVSNLMMAEKAISALANNNSVWLQPIFNLHTTLNYFCCYNSSQRHTVIQVLEQYQWSPLNITYSNFGCNVDHDGKTVYIHAQPDKSSQDSLFGFIRGIEKAVEAAGVPVPNPRVQAFHATLARVDPTYPADLLVKQMQGKDFGHIKVSYFITEPPYFHIIRAKST